MHYLHIILIQLFYYSPKIPDSSVDFRMNQ